MKPTTAIAKFLSNQHQYHFISAYALFFLTLFGSSNTWPSETTNNLLEPKHLTGHIRLLTNSTESQSLSGSSKANDKTDSLDQQAQSEVTFNPILLWKLNYLFPTEKTSISLSTPDDQLIDGAGYHLFKAEMSHKFSTYSSISAAIYPSIPIESEKVWKDPYVTGQNRETTQKKLHGWMVSANYLFDSYLSISYRQVNTSIDDEESGSGLINSIASENHDFPIESLNRNTEFSQKQADLLLPISSSTYFIPYVKTVKANAKGSAFDADSTGYGFTLTKYKTKIEPSLTVKVSHTHYKNIHPVFNKKRNDRYFSTTLALGINKPFDWDNIRLDSAFTYSNQISDIQFYDKLSRSILMSASYEF